MKKNKINDLEKMSLEYYENDIKLNWISLDEISDLDFEKTKMDAFSYHILYSGNGETQDYEYVDYIRNYLAQNNNVKFSKVVDLVLDLIDKCWSSYSSFLIEYYWQNRGLVDISFDKIIEKSRKTFLMQEELYPKSLIREFLIYCKEFYEIEFDQISKSNLSRENFLFAKSIIEDDDVSIEAVRRKYKAPN